ncbi:hypothetical protein ABB37_09127 [Leptomonas pyrrhocoris]|uniref:Uncharacterized protein n=1 Tax=Leptomonas pyrrhocoris TaxID=157538 RepID=A0A0M9FRK7_LEPPY|nr:hypothetical protein ABB37_09127 [Leptomonas pyrrhocoris]XP_015652875.1 hypothetical protein ABB37_09127 [Leptomonas pyrrhocoris]KPA74435.1 hypothetical protein ABB37_09127 [Leptomonas pyrrhocoris]KPA74436.1 hypothetical protein ABB37_09127 [Leptomonas pyrrhocoris]|eukprot:XP_015652874.1 hypothetical protein ABB37_09127 [Leptomonas pyrrhocoris]
MSDRIQVSCEKQGRDDTGSWSTRILTLDKPTGTVTISRHHHPNNVLYHSVRVSAVEQWPHFPQSTIGEDFNSLQAKRTLYLLGVEVPVPRFSLIYEVEEKASQPLSPAPRAGDGASDASSAAAPAAPAMPYAFTAGNPHKKSRPVETGGYDSWVVRFTTQGSYDAVVAMLHRMLQVRFNEGRSGEEFGVTGLLAGPAVVSVGLL